MSSILGAAKIVAFAGTLNRERSRAFYQDVLGLTLTEENDFAMVFDAGGTMLRVTPVPEMTPANYTVLGWEVKDMNSAVTELSERGVVFEGYGFLVQDEVGIWNAPGGAQVAWFKDPDGNLLSLSKH